MTRIFFRLCAVALTTGGLCRQAVADAVSFEATDNATIQPAGPRAGGNGKNFFNIEGSSYNNFASYGVADFNFATLDPPLTGTVTAISNVTLELTQSNAAFSVAGPFSVFYTAATTVDIQPGGTSPLTFQAGMDGADSVGPELQPLTLLGSDNYAVVANGTVDVVNLTLAGAPLAALIDALNNDTTFRLVVTPDLPTTAATYAGFGNNTFAGPTLKFDVTISGGFAAADFNNDGFVNGVDLSDHWKANYPKESGAVKSDGDADGNLAVDGADVLIWQQQLTALPVGATAVPEPASTLLLTASLGGLGLAARGRTDRRLCAFG